MNMTSCPEIFKNFQNEAVSGKGCIIVTSLCSYFCLFYLIQIIFAKGAHFTMSELTHSEYDVIGLDWTMDIHDARLTAPGQTLMGNLDPCALYANEVFYLLLNLHKCYQVPRDIFCDSGLFTRKLQHTALPLTLKVVKCHSVYLTFQRPQQR